MAAADYRMATDATLTAVKEAIEALPNATQEAAENANAAAADARTAVSQFDGVVNEINNGYIGAKFVPDTYIMKGDSAEPGAEKPATGWKSTEFINVPPWSKDYITIESELAQSSDGRWNCFYKSDKTYLSSFSFANGITRVYIPENAAYLRLSAPNAVMDKTFIRGVCIDKALVDKGILPDNSDFNDVQENCIYSINSQNTYLNSPVYSGYLFTFAYDSNIMTQMACELDFSGIYTRRLLAGSWSNWGRIDFSDRDSYQRINGLLADNTDFDDIKENGIWGLDSGSTYVNDPLPSSGFLECRSFNDSNIWVQTARDLINETSFSRWYFNGWRDWRADDFHDVRKVYYAFGDSITYGQVGGVGGQSKYNYPAVSGKLLKMNVKNHAVSGQGLIKDWGYIHTNYINNLDMSDANLITVSWAYNDSSYYSSLQFGAYTDTSDSSFIGKYFTIMKEFQQKCPKTKLILITGYGTPDGQVGPPVVKPTLETQFTYQYTFADGQHTTKEMYDTLEAMCHLHGWSCINQAKGTVLNQWNADDLIGDQIHPNNDGYILYGNYIGAQIASMYGNISY